MNSRLLAVAAALLTAIVCLGASLASADVVNTENVTIQTGDTPKLRLEQTNAGGFTAQSWDIAGNEANFFVRDQTASPVQLPFRIRPGAKSNGITLAANGNVGLGLIDAAAPLQIARDGAVSTLYTDTDPGPGPDVSWATGIPAGGGSFSIGVDGLASALTLAPGGDLGLLGAVSETATAGTVTNLQNVDPAAILQKLGSLPVRGWAYAATPGTRHLGPLAGDFSAAFGLGSASAISPADVAGVSLAGLQGLIARNQALSTRIQGAETAAAAAKAANTKLSKKVAKLSKQMKKLREAVAQLAK
jgi:hypothetical protein